jgi:hypothetical protein
VNNLNLEVFMYLPNILVTIEFYSLRVSITIKEHEKDRRASASPVFSLKLRPREPDHFVHITRMPTLTSVHIRYNPLYYSYQKSILTVQMFEYIEKIIFNK